MKHARLVKLVHRVESLLLRPLSDYAVYASVHQAVFVPVVKVVANYSDVVL